MKTHWRPAWGYHDVSVCGAPTQYHSNGKPNVVNHWKNVTCKQCLKLKPKRKGSV